MNIFLYSTSIWINDDCIKRGSLIGMSPPLRIVIQTVFYLKVLFGTVIEIILKIESEKELNLKRETLITH